ncbi:hypothetical protein VNO80_06447 [Phaseolus coccineus]|uniref:Uncharacterized protein n=1 Tax=Phaseolus coccineus TaxID=3886 RepID=A0AAN9NHI8_PHACN
MLSHRQRLEKCGQATCKETCTRGFGRGPEGAEAGARAGARAVRPWRVGFRLGGRASCCYCLGREKDDVDGGEFSDFDGGG